MDPEDGLLMVHEAARRMGVSRTTVYRLMDAGQLAYVKINRARRILPSSVQELIAKNLRGPHGG